MKSLDFIARAWCKTIVTTSFYIRSYNSFTPSPGNAHCISELYPLSQLQMSDNHGKKWPDKSFCFGKLCLYFSTIEINDSHSYSI